MACLLGFSFQSGFIVQAKWPTPLRDGEINEQAIEEIHYLVKVTNELKLKVNFCLLDIIFFCL